MIAACTASRGESSIATEVGLPKLCSESAKAVPYKLAVERETQMFGQKDVEPKGEQKLDTKIKIEVQLPDESLYNHEYFSNAYCKTQTKLNVQYEILNISKHQIKLSTTNTRQIHFESYCAMSKN